MKEQNSNARQETPLNRDELINKLTAIESEVKAIKNEQKEAARKAEQGKWLNLMTFGGALAIAYTVQATTPIWSKYAIAFMGLVVLIGGYLRAQSSKPQRS